MEWRVNHLLFKRMLNAILFLQNQNRQDLESECMVLKFQTWYIKDPLIFSHYILLLWLYSYRFPEEWTLFIDRSKLNW